MNWETEHYNSVLEIQIHLWEPDIYIGFSPALHLQCLERNSLVTKKFHVSGLVSQYRKFSNQFAEVEGYLPLLQ
jgi:hypothetical protein